MIADLDTPGSEIRLSEGGKPGLGSCILSGRTTKYGRLQKKMPEGKSYGQAGTNSYYQLELKTIADVGLVGYPNAGKSTLLRSMSKAEPEVAPYPFTTLHPFVGVVEFPDHFTYRVADLPGLIDGAHKNVGLGHDFLKHVERTEVLCYVLDASSQDGRSPVDDLRHLQRELELYAPQITTRPSLVVANKMDVYAAESGVLEALRAATDMTVIPISALHCVDIGTVVKSLRWMLPLKKQIK